MPTDWESFKEEIRTEVLEEMGNSLTVLCPSSYIDPVTKKKIVKNTVYTGIGVMGSYEEEAAGVANTIIKAGDVKFICSFDNAAFRPEENKSETIIFDGIKYSIIHARQVAPSGSVTIVWIVQGRRIG